MKQTEKTFQILDTLDRENISTQRELSLHSGISLGQVNYILKSLMKKGLIKIGNFKKHPHKISYMYYLTPKGIEAKSKLAVKFVIHKLMEYDSLRERLSERIKIIEKNGSQLFVFVGPKIVKDFINEIISEKKLMLNLVNHCNDWRDLKHIEQGSYDIVVLFDENPDIVENITSEIDLPEEKLLSLW